MDQYRTNTNYSDPVEVKARVARMTESTRRLIAWSDEVGQESERVSEEVRKYFASRK